MGGGGQSELPPPIRSREQSSTGRPPREAKVELPLSIHFSFFVSSFCFSFSHFLLSFFILFSYSFFIIPFIFIFIPSFSKTSYF